MAEAHPVAPPAPVAWLGYGGVIPFLVLAPASLLEPAHAALWREALHAYGAVILAFIGALHWGLAMALPGLAPSRRTACFAWSVVPALIAWAALLLPPSFAGPALIAGFLAHCLQDRRLAGRASLPGWYLLLRLRLSTVAVVCLVAGVFASPV